jgi:sporulation protein YlmC with PRC-barrel domain
MPQYMYLTSIRQTGDVILVEDEDVIETVEVDLYSPLINSEVITETGEPLGRVRDFKFNLDDGKVYSIIIASFGLPQIPDQVISTYELSMDEVVSSGPNRLIVFEGAEDRLTQLTVGVLERLGIGRPPWEREEEEEYYPPTIQADKQLGTGIPIRTPVATPVQSRTPVEVNHWDEDEWEEVRPAPAPPKRSEVMRYDEYEEEDNWGEYKEDRPVARYDAPPREYDDVDDDVWDDDIEADVYDDRPPLNITEKQKEKMPEYEEEVG